MYVLMGVLRLCVPFFYFVKGVFLFFVKYSTTVFFLQLSRGRFRLFDINIYEVYTKGKRRGELMKSDGVG